MSDIIAIAKIQEKFEKLQNDYLQLENNSKQISNENKQLKQILANEDLDIELLEKAMSIFNPSQTTSIENDIKLPVPVTKTPQKSAKKPNGAQTRQNSGNDIQHIQLPAKRPGRPKG